MLLVQLVTRVSYILRSNVILRRDTIVDLPDGFNSRLAQFRMENTRTETCCYRFISDTSQHPECIPGLGTSEWTWSPPGMSWPAFLPYGSRSLKPLAG